MYEREVIFTRHLATPNNISGNIMGNVLDIDIIGDPKSVEGLSAKIKLFATDLGIDAQNTLICTSPLKRCLSTSEVVAKALTVPSNFLIIKELEETNMGDFSGKAASELRQEFGSLVDEWMFNPEDFKFPNGESYQDLRVRVREVLRKISNEINHNEYRYVFVCTHVDIIKMTLSEVMGFSFNNRRSFTIGNGSVSVLDLNKENVWTVKGINIYP